MGYHPRIECKSIATFQTTRSQHSELWFVNNRALEEKILGYAAKYTKRYKVKLFALSIEGNHIQFPALFPKGNRAHFMRDFNSSVARCVPRIQRRHPGGRLWARRYSAEYLPGEEDIEEQFFYTVLQPVQDGLVDDISEYPGYNCFDDAIHERTKTYKVIRWKAYNDAKRWNDAVSIDDYTEFCHLKYERLPGYEACSKEEYVRLLKEKLRERTAAILQARGKKPSAGRTALLRVKPGAIPKYTKTSQITDRRPRVLSKNRERRVKGETWYFNIYFRYKRASKRYRRGEKNVRFPKGTYKPPAFTVATAKQILF